MDWLEIAVAAEDEAVDAVAERLRALGHGVAIEEPFLQPSLEEAPQRDFRRPVLVKTYVPADEAGAATCQEIERAMWHLARLSRIEPPRVERISEQDWANAWKIHFPVVRVGRSTVIAPAWRRHRRRPGEVVIRLDPGLAFGTGMHPTTRLCLAAIEELAKPGDRVLDVGTGSGVLAIAAIRRGAERVLALDIDPVAVGAARDNVRLNRLSRKIAVRLGDLLSSKFKVQSLKLSGQRSTFDLILSNITARVNADLAQHLAGLLASEGRLVASGILEESAAMVMRALQGAGLELVERRQEEDWVALIAAPGHGFQAATPPPSPSPARGEGMIPQQRASDALRGA